MKKKNIQSLTLFSVFSALIIAMTYIPFVGYITIPGSLSITTLHIAVILGALYLNTVYYGLALGGVWGITCLIYAYMNGTADSVIFIDPRISVLPRILVGLLIVCFYRLALAANKYKFTMVLLEVFSSAALGALAYLLLINVTSNVLVGICVGIIVFVALFVVFFIFKDKPYIPIVFATVMGTLSNTALVLFAINIFGNNGSIKIIGTLKNIFSIVIGINGTLELIAATVIVVPCFIALQKVSKRLTAN